MNLKIGVIIPDRGDRPLFTEHIKYLLSIQTMPPTEVLFVNYEPKSNEKDITQRYRFGYDYFRNKGFDVLFLIENDDWYSHNYIERQVTQWFLADKPDLFGVNYTIYYHIKLFKYYTMNHDTRCSAMCTLIKPDLNFAWCKDSEPYTDVWLFSQLKYELWKPAIPICLGIKHGVGLTGGHAHIDRLNAYTNFSTSKDDKERKFLKEVVEEKSLFFYEKYFN